MQFYRKAEEAARAILEAFESGSVPKAMAPVFIRRKDNVPCRAWSWSNQMIAALLCGGDARGYRQWQEVGRHVKRGEKAAHILVPLIGKKSEKDGETGEEKECSFLYGFTSAPVFGLRQTEGAPLPPPDPKATAWLEGLPLMEVAREWGLSVDAYTPSRLRELERSMALRGLGEPSGRAFIVNEAHGLPRAAIRQLLVIFDQGTEEIQRQEEHLMRRRNDDYSEVRLSGTGPCCSQSQAPASCPFPTLSRIICLQRVRFRHDGRLFPRP